MKCNSCSNIIDSRLSFAITQNICPYCGQQIMSDELKELLNNVKPLITSLEEKYEDVWLSWIKENFNMTKLRVGQPIVKNNSKKDDASPVIKNEDGTIIIPLKKTHSDAESIRDKVARIKGLTPSNPIPIDDDNDLEVMDSIDEEDDFARKMLLVNKKLKGSG